MQYIGFTDIFIRPSRVVIGIARRGYILLAKAFIEDVDVRPSQCEKLNSKREVYESYSRRILLNLVRAISLDLAVRDTRSTQYAGEREQN